MKNNALAVWVSDSTVDISSLSSLQMTLDAYYDVETNYDYFRVGLLLDDGLVYYGTGGSLTGTTKRLDIDKHGRFLGWWV